jgi:hypothetical protein
MPHKPSAASLPSIVHLLSVILLLHFHPCSPSSIRPREGPMDGLMGSGDDTSPPIDNNVDGKEAQDEKAVAETQGEQEDEQEAEQDQSETYYCHHIASCGTRSNPGPPTADSTLSGYECYCRGEGQLGLAYMCYQGACYDGSRDTYRKPSEIDRVGLCAYTTLKPADLEFCRNSESSEKLDPNLRPYTDPPFLVVSEDQESEIAASEKIGSEASQ